MNIQDKIRRLNNKSRSLKLQLNTYYFNNTSRRFIDDLIEQRISIKKEIKELKILKERHEKILNIQNKIKNNINYE